MTEITATAVRELVTAAIDPVAAFGLLIDRGEIRVAPEAQPALETALDVMRGRCNGEHACLMAVSAVESAAWELAMVAIDQGIAFGAVFVRTVRDELGV